ncbi:hypothetical protein BH20PSE1_BH20PSE1_01490 [soil metagenome]
MIRRPPRRDVLIRLNPAAKIFLNDTYAEARAKCIKEMGSRWILFDGRVAADGRADGEGKKGHDQ